MTPTLIASQGTESSGEPQMKEGPGGRYAPVLGGLMGASTADSICGTPFSHGFAHVKIAPQKPVVSASCRNAPEGPASGFLGREPVRPNDSASTRRLGRRDRRRPARRSSSSKPDRVTGPGEKPRHPTDHMADYVGDHMATTASMSSSTVAPLAWGSPSSPSATAWASLAYSFLERPDSISRDATTTSVFQCRLPASSSH